MRAILGTVSNKRESNNRPHCHPTQYVWFAPYLFGLNHTLDHNDTETGENLGVEALTERDVSRSRLHHSAGAEVQQRQFHDRELLDLFVKLCHQLGPVLQANLEDLALLDLRDLEQVLVSDQQHLAVLRVLDKLVYCNIGKKVYVNKTVQYMYRRARDPGGFVTFKWTPKKPVKNNAKF